MNYTGKIENGVAVLNPPVTLPEGTSVRIEVDHPNVQNWSNKTVEELAREQGVVPVTDLSSLFIDWPEEDSIDDFLTIVREVRH